ncbi:YkgJ family cysteine cluster protein [Fusibacter sp. 3D3]|uniref:YkgJ family cysteine cluster protein n=1 Tax=Fusibacter sp. 3D3 TaxID=1048380 RepID=UPI000852EEF8|nr:YkgJ family cysteine cluster protein [Fusibacter sp. 3D3]GAU77049.1 protein of unknown function UPF0153 [Fusibacter sp. 3D3]
MRTDNRIKYCVENNIFDSLNKIYEAVPSGQCQGCTKCCHESVNISMVEALNILHQYYEKENGEIVIPENIKMNLIKYYFSEWIMPKKCPFLSDENLCSIYQARPLPCRIFGNRSRHAFNKNLDLVRKQNKRVARAILMDLKLKVPLKVINRTIEYCENYQRGRLLDEGDVNALYDSLINLEGKLYFSGVMEEMMMNQHLVGFFIEAILLNETYEVVTSKLLQDIRLDILRSIPMNK